MKDIRYNTFLDILLISLPVGLVGARLYYVLFEFAMYRNNIMEIFDIRQGGLAIHGGIIFGALSTYFFAHINKIRFLKIADIAASSVVIAQAMGRWGNFFNQEAHGGPVSYDFIKYFPGFIQEGMKIDGVYYHPTFLYEFLWNLIVFVILIVIIKTGKEDGMSIVTYLGLYSVGRFFIETLRTDSLMLGSLKIAQVVSLCGVLIWIAFLIRTRYFRKSANDIS